MSLFFLLKKCLLGIYVCHGTYLEVRGQLPGSQFSPSTLFLQLTADSLPSHLPAWVLAYVTTAGYSMWALKTEFVRLG